MNKTTDMMKYIYKKPFQELRDIALDCEPVDDGHRIYKSAFLSKDTSIYILDYSYVSFSCIRFYIVWKNI